MIDIATDRDAYEKIEIHSIGWITGCTNIAYALTKLESNKRIEELLDTGIFNLDILQ